MSPRRCGWTLGASLFLVTSQALGGHHADQSPANEPVALTVPGPAPTPVTPTPPPSCTCGDRRGLSRWRWHLHHCKRDCQEKFLGYPEEFNEWPLGRAVYAHANTQVTNGNAARMVFYDYDFVSDGDQLNLRGQDKLTAIAARLPTNFFPIIIERTPQNPGLDQARRLAILNQLSSGSFPVPAERVVIGRPIANGMRGIDGLLVEQNRLGNILSGGSLIGTGGVGAGTGVGPGSFDGGGLSGAAFGGAGVFGR